MLSFVGFDKVITGVHQFGSQFPGFVLFTLPVNIVEQLAFGVESFVGPLCRMHRGIYWPLRSPSFILLRTKCANLSVRLAPQSS